MAVPVITHQTCHFVAIKLAWFEGDLFVGDLLVALILMGFESNDAQRTWYMVQILVSPRTLVCSVLNSQTLFNNCIHYNQRHPRHRLLNISLLCWGKGQKHAKAQPINQSSPSCCVLAMNIIKISSHLD